MYVAVTTEIDGGLYAYAVKLSESDNVKSKLDGIAGLKYANVFSTKRRACEVVSAWNDAYKSNGTYAFSAVRF